MSQAVSIDMLIIGHPAELELQLRAIAIPAYITLNISTLATLEAASADILIFNIAAAQSCVLNNISCSECVLCAPQSDAASLLGSPAWTAFWPQPTAPDVLEFYLHQILASVQTKKELATANTYLDTMIDSVPDLIWFKDSRGSHLKVNDAFCRAVGKTKEQCEGRGHYYIWDLEPDEYAKGEYVCLETEEEVIRQNKTCLFDEKVKSKNGLRQFKTYKSPLVDSRGHLFGTVGIAKDVTDLQNMDKEMEVILASVPFAAIIADSCDSIISVNQNFCDYFDVEMAQIHQMRYSDVCTEILHTTPLNLQNIIMTELTHEHGGIHRVFRAQQQPIHDIFGSHFGTFFLCIDVTKEHDLQNKILLNANTDFLTGLYNRRYFYEFIDKKTDAWRVSFVYFDLDNFKKVNDTHGHKRGDDVLILMAALLQKAFPNQLIARLGGDEFAVAFSNPCMPDDLEPLVAAFIEHAREVFLATQNMEDVTVSAGIACNSLSNTHDVDTLLSYADKALYAAKALGKSRYCVYNG